MKKIKYVTSFQMLMLMNTKLLFLLVGTVQWDFSRDKSIKEATKEVYEEGGIVGALCHGPAALVDVKLSDGKYLVAGKKNRCLFKRRRENS